MNAETYVWNFGDNTPVSTEVSPAHIFAQPGTYEVKLEALKNDLSNDTVITVNLNSQVLIVNNGNYGQGNGSISLYDETMQNMVNAAVSLANGGSEIGAGIESLFINDGVGYVICNVADKIEFIDANSLMYLDNPLSGLITPRYMTHVNGMGYVTCWGSYSPTFSLDASYVAIVDLSQRTVIDTVKCGSGPEGIIAVGSKVYIANSYETTITVYDTNLQDTTNIKLDAAPQHFELDGNGLLWASLGSFYGAYPQDKIGLVAINTSTNSVDTFVNFPGISDEGEMTIDQDGSTIYFLTAEPWPSTATNVFTLNTNSKIASAAPLISGENYYGIGYNTLTEKLYVADAAAFQGAGKILVFTPDGTKLDEQVSGVGPFHFVF
jgi:PKD repeat protein